MITATAVMAMGVDMAVTTMVDMVVMEAMVDTEEAMVVSIRPDLFHD